MNIQDIFTFIAAIFSNPDFLVKAFLVVLLSLYLLFALVVARQVGTLATLVNQVSFTPIFKFIAWSMAALTLFLLIAVILV